jgi:hypothetical protein
MEPSRRIDRWAHAAEWGKPLILDEELRCSDIPGEVATRGEIESFAWTFPGYQAFDQAELSAIHRDRLTRWRSGASPPGCLTLARAALFFEQRTWHWNGAPDGRRLAFAHYLIQGIRRRAERQSKAGWFRGFELQRLAEYAAETADLHDHILPSDRAAENLHTAFREDVVRHFTSRGIKWWRGPRDEGPQGPTGYLSSSQISCVNHLEPARLDHDTALRIGQAVEPSLQSMVDIPGEGFVAYEWIGAEPYLNEPGRRQRGANVTSIDAVLVGARHDGTRVLVVLEWKYLERYGARSTAVSRRGTDRIAIYAPDLRATNSPITARTESDIFYEPFDQLMRQTLLAWHMTEAKELGASEWRHALVAPAANTDLRNTITSPALAGHTIQEAWVSVLRDPARFVVLTAAELLREVDEQPTTQSEWRGWLWDRYRT